MWKEDKGQAVMGVLGCCRCQGWYGISTEVSYRHRMEPVREREREIIGAEVSRMGEARMPKAAGTQIILS